jgi:hypothetical protein
LPQGTLLKTVSETKNEVEQFVALHKLDKENEKFPLKVFKRRESLKIDKMSSEEQKK